MMVTLSMGVLQCNLFANVSTVAGEPYFDSLCGSRLGLWPLGPSGQLQRSSTPVGQWADLPTTQGSNHRSPLPPRSGTTFNANGFEGGNCFCL